MPDIRSYILCTAPRSGSTLLCSLLKSTGVAGDPKSLFHRPTLDDWAKRLKVPRQPGWDQPTWIHAMLQAARDIGRGETGIFGVRQQPHGFHFLIEKLQQAFPGAGAGPDLFDRAFGHTHMLYLHRSDKLRQAVSCVKAEQTGLWHVAPDGTEIERTAPHRAPVFDAAWIAAQLAEFEAFDQMYETWFARHNVTPLRISYDDLARDPREVLRRVLSGLHLDPARADQVTPGVRKLSDETSEAWVARFRAERPATSTG